MLKVGVHRKDLLTQQEPLDAVGVGFDHQAMDLVGVRHDDDAVAAHVVPGIPADLVPVPVGSVHPDRVEPVERGQVDVGERRTVAQDKETIRSASVAA